MARHTFSSSLLVFALACGCAPEPAPAEGCVPGASVACACPDGRTGAQSCTAARVFDACSCTGPVPVGDGGAPAVDDGGTSGDLAIERTAPAGDTAYVREVLSIQLTVRGDAERVELLVDDVALADLAPPYTYAWDTRSVSEGAHTIIGRATRGAQVVETAPLQVVVDRTQPRLVAHSPSAGELNAWLGAPIELTFSEPLAPATVDEAFIALSANDAVGLAKTTTLDGDGTSIDLRLTGAPVLPALVRVDVGSTATDLAGNPVVASAFSFTAPAWARVGVTAEVPQSVPVGWNAALAIDSTGARPCAAYVDRSMTPPSLEVSCFDGAAWSRRGAALAADYGSLPAIALDATGAPVVAWPERVSSETVRVEVARWSGASWVALGDGLPPVSYGGAVSLVLDDAGDPFVAWVGEQTNLRVHHWDGGAWTEIGASITGTSIGAIDLARTHDGRPVLAWSADGRCRVRTWTGTEWRDHASSVPTDSELGCADVSLAVDSTDAPVVAVYLAGSPYTPYTRMFAWQGEAWTSVRSGLELFRCSAPQLAIAPDGTPTLAYYDGNSGRVGIRVERRASDGTWLEIGYFPQHDRGRLALYGGAPALMARRGDDLEVFRSNALR